MSPRGVTRSILVAFLVLLCLESSCAVNIEQIMKGYPNFSKMAAILAQPDVSKQMNIQPAITILALDNDAMDSLSVTKRPEEVTDIVKCHVAFDYYDLPKMNNRPVNHPAEMVNLYQSSGHSEYGQGLTQLKKTIQGIVFFSTSTNSTKDDAKFVKTLYTSQFNVSILQVDHPMLISGLNDQLAPAVSPLPPKEGSDVPAPDSENAPASAPEEEEVGAESPTDDTYATTTPDAPASAPAEGPAADEDSSNKDAADEGNDEETASSAGRRAVGLSLVFASAFLAAVAF